MRTLAALVLLCMTVRVEAQPADEYNTDWLKEPYQLLLVVQAEPHPLLTNVYVEQFARDLGDSLQRDMGRSAKVSTLIYRDSDAGSSDAPKQMMEAVINRGWSELDNLPKQINPTKVHLVRLFYVDGEYEVQSRQVDGDTSIVSILRKSRTSDRQWISRLAALQVSQDFGQVGEIVEVNNQTLRIKMRAGGLGVPETIRMVQGEAMALAQVRRTTNSYTAIRLPETIAFITNVDAVKGIVTARLYTRMPNPLARDRQTIAFRAIRLGTRVTPVQLKVVDQDNNPIGGYSVSHFPSGYENGGAESLGTTDVQGRVTSKEPVYHVAFVRVQIAGVGKLDTPVALLDEQPVIVKISNNREAAIIDETKFEYDRWMRKYKEVKDNFEVDFKTLYLDVMKKGDTKKAIDNLTMIVNKLKEATEELRAESGRITKAAQTSKQALEYVNSATNALKGLDQSCKDMQETVSQELNPTEDRKFLKLAKQAEADFDYDEAILNYKKSYSINKNQPKVVERIKALERIWKQQYNDKEHKEARTFAINVWSSKTKSLTWEEIGREISNAERYLDDLEKRGDYLTVLVMLNGNLKHLITLNTAREALGNGEDVQEKQVIIEKTRKALIDFNKKARDFAEKAINDENKAE